MSYTYTDLARGFHLELLDKTTIEFSSRETPDVELLTNTDATKLANALTSDNKTSLLVGEEQRLHLDADGNLLLNITSGAITFILDDSSRMYLKGWLTTATQRMAVG